MYNYILHQVGKILSHYLFKHIFLLHFLSPLLLELQRHIVSLLLLFNGSVKLCFLNLYWNNASVCFSDWVILVFDFTNTFNPLNSPSEHLFHILYFIVLKFSCSSFLQFYLSTEISCLFHCMQVLILTLKSLSANSNILVNTEPVSTDCLFLSMD